MSKLIQNTSDQGSHIKGSLCVRMTHKFRAAAGSERRELSVADITKTQRLLPSSPRQWQTGAD